MITEIMAFSFSPMCLTWKPFSSIEATLFQFYTIMVSDVWVQSTLLLSLFFPFFSWFFFLWLLRFWLLLQVYIRRLVHASYCSKIEVSLLLGWTMPTISCKRWALIINALRTVEQPHTVIVFLQNNRIMIYVDLCRKIY